MSDIIKSILKLLINSTNILPYSITILTLLHSRCNDNKNCFK